MHLRWRTAVEHYVGIYVSLKLSNVCVVDGRGKIVKEAKVASEPEALVCRWIKLSTLRRRAWLVLCASQIVLLWLMPFDARQQFFFQRSPELREPLNFRLAPIEVLDNLGEPLNLHLETIKQINNLAVLVAERVETWVCRHHPAHSLFILGEP